MKSEVLGHVVEIRIAGAVDCDKVRALIVAFRDHLGADAPSDTDVGAMLPRLLDDASIEFAWAELDGVSVGYTQTRYYASVWVSGTEALLEDLFVVASARALGIGRALLHHALDRARQRGARLLGLCTNERNEAAQTLYRSAGLRPQGAKIWKDGREVRWTVEL